MFPWRDPLELIFLEKVGQNSSLNKENQPFQTQKASDCGEINFIYSL